MTRDGPGPVVAVPTSIADIMPTWLGEALRAGGHGVTIIALDVQPIGGAWGS